MRLEGKLAFVTGAASGIGKHIAQVYARAGAAVAVADLNPQAAEAAAAELRGLGAHAMAVGVDVTDEAAVDAAVARTVAELGGLDILVSNAGIQIVAPLVDFSFADWKKLLAVHLDGAFLTSRAAMRQMIASGRGGSMIFLLRRMRRALAWPDNDFKRLWQ